MTTTTQTAPTGFAAQALIDGYASKITAALTEQANALPHDFSERLRASRVRAVSQRKREVELAFNHQSASHAATNVQAVGGAASLGGSASFGGGFFSGGDGGFWNRLGSILPLIGLVAGLWFVIGDQDDSRINEIALVDAALLSDDLPPAAYADPGFAQFIKNPR